MSVRPSDNGFVENTSILDSLESNMDLKITRLQRENSLLRDDIKELAEGLKDVVGDFNKFPIVSGYQEEADKFIIKYQILAYKTPKG